MGEIADALRKANAERAARESAPPAPQRAAPEPLPIEPEPRRAREARAEPLPEPKTEESDHLPDVQVDGAAPRVDLARHLALRVLKEMDARGAHSLAVVSPLRDEGKTTVAAHLALAMASLTGGEAKVALVDLDLRNPSVAVRLGLSPVRTGVDEVLLGRSTLDDARIALANPRIDVFPVRKPRAAAHELLVRPSFADMIRELHARYQVVVVDTPPTLLVPDSTLILQHVGCCAPVAHSGVTRVRMFKKMLAMLPPEQVTGKILNGAAIEKHEREYYAYGYGDADEAEAEAVGRERSHE